MRQILLLIALSWVGIGFAQTKYTNVMVGDGPARSGPEEPCMAINLQDPDNLVVGANIRNVYYSKDGGKSWKHNTMKSKYGVFGDPCVIAAPDGSFHFFHLSDPTGKNWASDEVLDRIVAQRSTDGGKKWSRGTYMGFNGIKDQDKEWAVIDPRNGHIYVTWTQFDLYNSKQEKDSTHILFSRSEDDGKSWSKAERINQHGGNCLDDDRTVEGAVPAVGPDGEVYVAWSFDEKIWFDRSLDGGKTWLPKDRVAADQPGGWTYSIPGISRTNGLPVTVCDLSDGPNRGTIYVCWSDQRNGEDDTDIWLVSSKDRGETWTKPLRVNDDGPGKHQFFGWLTIDQSTGKLYIVYYDRRNHIGMSTDVYLASSSDGGQSFVNERISESPFVPDSKIFFGDYCHVAAVNGRVRPVWTRLDEGRISVWTALIDE